MAGAAGGHGSAMQIRLDVASERSTTLRHGLKDLRADIKQERPSHWVGIHAWRGEGYKFTPTQECSS